MQTVFGLETVLEQELSVEVIIHVVSADRASASACYQVILRARRFTHARDDSCLLTEVHRLQKPTAWASVIKLNLISARSPPGSLKQRVVFVRRTRPRNRQTSLTLLAEAQLHLFPSCDTGFIFIGCRDLFSARIVHGASCSCRCVTMMICDALLQPLFVLSRTAFCSAKNLLRHGSNQQVECG